MLLVLLLLKILLVMLLLSVKDAAGATSAHRAKRIYGVSSFGLFPSGSD